ncbi:NADH-quinone oxidoreductase subunit C [Bdellovibrionota bacterium FG-2]
METQVLSSAVLALDSRATPREKTDRLTVTIPVEALFAFLSKLKTDTSLAFDMLCTHTAIDWIAEQRFELIYELYSTAHSHALRVTAFVSRENPVVPSVSSLWQIGEWQEREAYDMFGILYKNHPDLRRVLLDDGWQGFPLRKDYKDDYLLERPE